MGWKFWKSEKSEAEKSLEGLQTGAAAARATAATAASREADARVEGPGDFSMVIEDVFSIVGRGTVITGRVESGTVSVGMAVTLMTAQNGDVPSTVTGVEMFRQTLQTATAGDNVGLLLAGVSRSDLTRGDTIVG